MAYTVKNYRTGKAVRDALKAGDVIRVYQPGPFSNGALNGTIYLEGPHYPEPHRWYLSGTAKDGVLVKINK